METPDPKYKHKPSEKHTLEEVLKSLQDLIHNDLIEGHAGTAKPEAPTTHARQPDAAPAKTPEPKLRRESKPVVREDFAPVSPGSGPVNLDAVMRSLKDLIGNELNVGDEPKPASEKPAATHDEYLSEEAKIEEYIPEGLAQLDDEPGVDMEHPVEEPASATPRETLPEPEEIIAAGLPEELTPFDEAPTPEDITPLDEALTSDEPLETSPPPAVPTAAVELPGETSIEMDQKNEEPVAEEFTPLDEALTFEAPLQPEPPPLPIIETTELPGEISPELLEEPAPAPEPTPEPEPAPAITASSAPAPLEALAPGEQGELFFEAAPPRSPEPVVADSAPDMAAEPAPVPEPPAPADNREQAVEAKQENEIEALPVIEVDEDVDEKEYLAAATEAAPPPEPEPESEETIALDAVIDAKPEIVAPPVAEISATPELAQTPATPKPTAAPAEPAAEKITLETAPEPAKEKPRDAYSVDFDASDLTPPLPEESELSLSENGAPLSEAPAESAPPSVDFELSDLTPPPPEEPALAPPETETAKQNEATAETAKAESAPATEPETAAPTPEPPAAEAQSEAPAEPEPSPKSAETAKDKSAPTAEPEAAAPPPEAPAVEAKTETPAETKPPPKAAETAAPKTPAPNKHDDIPVLNEVVAPPAKGGRKARPKAPPPEQPPLPAPDRAREIVVRAVAKLNVEMRKTGSAGLDTKTILRLQQLIRQELEKGGEK